MNQQPTTTEYRGFKIKADDYLRILDKEPSLYRKCFWVVYDENGAEIANTLWNDDKMWDSFDSAIKAAKQEIDAYLDEGKRGYFRKGQF